MKAILLARSMIVEVVLIMVGSGEDSWLWLKAKLEFDEEVRTMDEGLAVMKEEDESSREKLGFLKGVPTREEAGEPNWPTFRRAIVASGFMATILLCCCCCW